MADMANAETERFLSGLLQQGILSQEERNRIWRREYVKMDSGGAEFTTQDIVDNLPFDDLRNSEIVAVEDMADDFDFVAPERTEMQIIGAEYKEKTSGGLDPVGFFGEGIKEFAESAGKLVSPITGAWDWYDKSLQADTDVPGGLDTVHMLQRTLTEMGYDTIPAGRFRNDSSMEEVVETVMRLNDMTRSEVDAVMYAVENDLISRLMTEEDIKGELEAVEEMDTTNLANPEYSKNLRAFEILDRSSPTKYQFDDESGAIFRTDGLGQVDRSGNVVEPGSQQASDLVGGWSAGVAPEFGRHEGGLADGLETGWEKMTRESGTAVDEFMYYDVLDVVSNKQNYGADPTRYLPGQANFLGGYASTYRIDPDETVIAQHLQDRSQYDIGFGSAGGEQFLAQLQGEMQMETLRPQYDKDDEWAQFVGLSAENKATVQHFLVDIGALDAEDVVFGTWFEAEAQQMYKVLDIANATGQSWDQIDRELLRNKFDAETASTTQRAAFVPEAYRPMDPARAELTVKDSVRQMLGRDPTDEDMAHLGGYLTDMHAASYEADVHAARNRYNTQVSLDESGGGFGQPAAVEDVDYEARYITEMEKKFAPQLESQEGAQTAQKQQNMGVQMSNLMGFIGGV